MVYPRFSLQPAFFLSFSLLPPCVDYDQWWESRFKRDWLVKGDHQQFLSWPRGTLRMILGEEGILFFLVTPYHYYRDFVFSRRNFKHQHCFSLTSYPKIGFLTYSKKPPATFNQMRFKKDHFLGHRIPWSLIVFLGSWYHGTPASLPPACLPPGWTAAVGLGRSSWLDSCGWSTTTNTQQLLRGPEGGVAGFRWRWGFLWGNMWVFLGDQTWFELVKL